MNDDYYMGIALQLAKSVKYQTSPNPPVGAVIVKDDSIIGMGAHLKSGEAHAEIIALNMAREAAYEATLYVTLEPCSFTGKTGPCTDAIIDYNIKRVVVGSIDRNQHVCGTGIQKLQAAGIDVTTGILTDEIEALYNMFFHYMENKMPFITLKVAMTLDGKIATKTGDSKWITGEPAREDVHKERQQHDAILVGVRTVLADNPRLTNRFSERKNPVRIILDTHLRTPLKSNVVWDQQSPTWIFVAESVSDKKIELYESYEQVRVIQMNENKINLKKVLEYIGHHGITSVLVEGGAAIHGSFLTSGYFNQYICYIAPKLIGGSDARTPIEGKGISSLVDAHHLDILTVETIGSDIKLIAEKRG